MVKTNNKVFSLAAISYSVIKPNLPKQILVDCAILKQKLVNVKREEIICFFLSQCKSSEVFPNLLLGQISKRHRSRLKFSTAHIHAIDDEINKREECRKDFQQSYETERQKYVYQNLLLIDSIVSHYTTHEINKLRHKYDNQLNSLIKFKRATQQKESHQHKKVINLTNTQLTKSEQNTLEYGMNMTWPIHYTQKVELEHKIELERFYNNIEKHEKPSEENLDGIKTKLKAYHHDIKKIKIETKKSDEMHIKNLKKLGKNKKNYTAKFDKGNGVCIDNKDTYIRKMEAILSDNTRFRLFKMDKRVKKSPFIYIEEKFNRELLKLQKSCKISSEIYDKVRSTGSQPARLYGLPKIHKNAQDPKYRPILSMTNSFCTNLAKWLDSLLKPFLPSTYTVKDTFEFVEDLRAASINSDQFFVSYDVTSLFTQIPVDETIDFICNFVPMHEMPIRKNVLKELLKMSCKNIMFQFNNKLYEQFDGMCMGSNLGPTMAAFAMHMVEEKYTIRPTFYKRYVDDIFAVFNTQKEADEFHKHINSIHPNIQFTQENETNNSIIFLDVCVTKSDNQIHTKWNLKTTNTGTYIHKTAHSPTSHKTGAMRSLIYRAYRICSSQILFDECFETIEAMFINNGFHPVFINKIKKKVILKQQSQISKQDKTARRTLYITTNYIQAHDKHLRKVAKTIEEILGKEEVAIRIAHRTRKTQSFFQNKDKIDSDVKSSLIYAYECDTCPGHTYIGESIRHFKTRKLEHLTGDKGDTEITLHQHTKYEENFRIVIQTKQTLIAESLVYHTIPPHLRLNKYHPPFELKLFDCDTSNGDANNRRRL